ncbi:MAG TPA: Co2+/Mg2+ efflux protein ApaG [Flavobacteriales bacterium]|jgi:ApaG protein|nr:Co2+/Mg2+ efflux protein ApaG [Crocinitomicaceae bacterium]HAE31950.1 Co2+/Mg2+ efflux protein ApaG [Flavobacteriales bacterium]
MTTAIDQGIRISVSTDYREDYSDPNTHHFLFSYSITIENTNNFPAQLMKRAWFIVDSGAENRQVEGDGVVGVQPIIQPGESYNYESACDLKTDYGSMKGFYFFKNTTTEEMFRVRIPEFVMAVPHKFN